MQNIQEVFNRMEENKKKRKELQQMIKDALSTSQAYQDAAEEAKIAADKRKQAKKDVESQFTNELVELDDLKIDIQSDQELLADIAMTQLMQGETVQIVGKNDEEYEPIFSVKFKKIQ